MAVWLCQENNNNGGGEEPRIVPFVLHEETTESYVAYALSVLLGCALPDVRDSLKPVHRRILLSLGMSSKKPYKKSARVVGEVLGKFHPHGDTAVYDSLVRMAQSFSLRCQLIQGHENFSSIDEDPALRINPQSRSNELLEYMPAPDFPTGGTIMGNLGRRRAGDDDGRRHTAHGTKRNLIQTAQSLQTSL
ncbi:hypothetical protein N665_4150s0004 [Sinapis alba]|nr:hypothetical protein N665_4150s0004 [Sinapis alba]